MRKVTWSGSRKAGIAENNRLEIRSILAASKEGDRGNFFKRVEDRQLRDLFGVFL
jgi:hypothetical protein